MSFFPFYSNYKILSIICPQRLLNQGPDYKCYYHECFLRGRPELTKMMQRLINPGKRLPDKAGEPDFYEISRQYPLPAGPTISDSNPMLRTPAAFTGYQKPPAPAATPAEASGAPQAPGQMGGQAGAAGGYPYPYPGMPYPPQYGQPPSGYPQGMPQQPYGWPGQPMPPFSPGGTGASDPNTPQQGGGGSGSAAAPGGAPAPAPPGGSGAPAGAPGQMPGGMPGYQGYPYPPMHPHMYWQQAQYMGSPYGQFPQQPFYPPGYAPGSPGKGGPPGGPSGFDPSQQPVSGAAAPAPEDVKAGESDTGEADDGKKPSAEEAKVPTKEDEEKEAPKEAKESTGGSSESLPF